MIDRSGRGWQVSIVASMAWAGICGWGLVSMTLSSLEMPFHNVAYASQADTWYEADWSFRREITIDHTKVAAGLADYPFLFSATDDAFKGAAEGGMMGRDDGGDVLFTLGDGTTKLSHELEEYVSRRASSRRG